ncbi:MAG: tetratricopeptide repeat protein [SAR324 cluster bacterium]|nr:tetratricopeptide repeat protein [SAR324 cluster bacterium]
MGFRQEFLYSKKIAVTILTIILAVWLIAFWYGGHKKWDLMGIGFQTGDSSSQATAYEERLKESPDDPALMFNLAYFYYRQSRFGEAEKLLLEILRSSHLDTELIQKASYNLGNSLFRLSENIESSQQAIELLKRSLDRYRSAIEIEREQQRYVSLSVEGEQDARFNYAIVKKRIKILSDQLEKKNLLGEKEVFALLKELLEEENQIKTQLRLLQSEKLSNQSRDQRNSLLKKRAQNLERLQVVKKRVRQVMQSQLPSSTPPTI